MPAAAGRLLQEQQSGSIGSLGVALSDTGQREGLISDERKELVELRRERRRLEMENEILKRAAAYFTQENVLPT